MKTGDLSTRTFSEQIEAHTLAEAFRQIIDHSPDAVFVQTEDEFVFANSAGLKMLGADSFEQIARSSLFDFVGADSKVVLRANIKSCLRNNQQIALLKHQIHTLQNEILEVETSFVPIDWCGVQAVQIRFRPMTIKTRYELQLRESEARFHQLADAMPQMVWTADANGTIDYHNKKWFEQTGLTEQDANAFSAWNAILHPEDGKKVSARWNQCVAEGKPFQMEYRYKMASGEYRWHLGRALPIKNGEGKVVRWFGTCTDIHDQKLVEIALQETKEELAKSAANLERVVAERTTELEETVRSSEALNYSIAHDLRAPLRAMTGFSKALLEEYGPRLDQTGQEYAGRIAASAQRMDILIGSLLAYGRLNYEELSFGFINTQTLLEGLVREFDPEIKQSNAKVFLRKPLPSVWANGPVLKKIFAELIENALKFHEPDRAPEVEIWAEESETKTLIWIRDKGIGIPPEHHERIFRVLECLNTEDKFSGTGIGLAIVRRGVERLGGKIGLKSAPDQGSCFWIELPKALF